MKKSLYKSNCGIIDKNIPTPKEIYEFEKLTIIYKSNWYLDLTKKIDALLKKGFRHFIITTTPASLLAAEYISLQKKKHLRYHRIRFHLIIPSQFFLSYLKLNLREYPTILKLCDEFTVLSDGYYNDLLSVAIQLLKSKSDYIFEI